MKRNPTIGDACNITTGKLDSNYAVVGGKYPFFTCAAEPSTIDSYAFDDSVILIAGNNASGNFHVNRYRGKFNAYQRTYVLTAKPGYDLDYVFYSLRLGLRRLREKAQGSQTKFLTLPILKDIPLIGRNLRLQHKISSVLVALDSKIELNKQINAEMERIAKTLYEYWFVQFDFPDEAGKPYKSSGGRMQWKEQIKREIPANWEVYELEDIVRCNYHSIAQNQEREFINYLDTSNLTENVIDAVQYINLNLEIRPSRAQRIIHEDDILYSTVRPDQHHFGIIKHLPENLIASTGFAQLTSKRKELTNELIYLYLTSASVINRLQKIADGSVSSYPSISPTDLLDLNIALPRDDDLLKIAGPRFAVLFEKQSINQQENKKLAELRDWLLPMLMNGQVKVREEGDTNTLGHLYEQDEIVTSLM